ncbi:MAG: glycoside hydrolase family 37 [Clostridia bacterium]|nr:glycoside hydrolase family 37 [Clostridia bacterium]
MKSIDKYVNLINDYVRAHYKKMFREPKGILKYHFIVPGSCYSNELWDWDSWLTDIALRQLNGIDDISEYEKGCILNFLTNTGENGETPIVISPERCGFDFINKKETNIHKPMIAQHALFAGEQSGDYDWLKPYFDKLEAFISFYFERCRHESGLFFWIDDCAIGVDNDPCTFYRPDKSSASILLNCLMYKELLAMERLSRKFGFSEKADDYYAKACNLRESIRKECWDERDGFFYSVDLNLLPIDKNSVLHSGSPRHWNCLLQRIGVWSGFLAMWSGIATEEQAERMVVEHYLNERTFFAPFGVRTLSKMEKMYKIETSCNPSCWLGPVWGISNYMVFKGLVNYGYVREARELAYKTIKLFGKDIEDCGEMHEYYDPETGKGISNQGFQSWNFLVLEIIRWVSGN